VDRRLFDLGMTITGLLNLPLHVDDGFPGKVTSPSNHIARNLSLLLGEDGLDGGDSLPEDKEHDMRPNWSNVVDSSPESDRDAFTSAGQRLKRV